MRCWISELYNFLTLEPSRNSINDWEKEGERENRREEEREERKKEEREEGS